MVFWPSVPDSPSQSPYESIFLVYINFRLTAGRTGLSLTLDPGAVTLTQTLTPKKEEP